MDEPQSLDNLFKQRIYRIPDYQRGYAWKRDQLKDFWEDLVNLADNRSHYTGVLTLKAVPRAEIRADDKEYWLVEDHSYQVFHIVDGQQRLTTFIIFLQALAEVVQSLPDYAGKPESQIYLGESLNLDDLQRSYLFKVKPTGDQFRTYKFGYTEDNPSYNYLRYVILREQGGAEIEETFYTLNLSNAKTYFIEQLRELHEARGIQALKQIYKAISKRFLFNEYVIKDEFDVYIAFETMNNRGKKLSDLELLKNRLIYLTTLFSESELDPASRKSLRENINDAWKEVYYQLGRSKTRPLNDDEFLRAHWIMYFKYSRKTGQAYVRFLLDEQFSPKRVYKIVERDVDIMQPEEIQYEAEQEESNIDNGEAGEDGVWPTVDRLDPLDIRNFVLSLNASAQHWFRSFFPEKDASMSEMERSWIDRLNRIGIGYFRPLTMSILKNIKNESERIRAFENIERFIFIAFRMNQAMATFGNSEFYNAARALDRGEIDLSAIEDRLEAKLSYTFNDDSTFRITDFHNLLEKKFKSGGGYYSWSGLRYFLYEYELEKCSESRQKKVDWNDLLKTEHDMLSIEHIYPQTETVHWASQFEHVKLDLRKNYSASIGNLLLLSSSINSSLQNDDFDDKKRPKYGIDDRKLRNGYSDGSHSEIEVSEKATWGPSEIEERGVNLLKFMERRWRFRFRDDVERKKLLFLNSESLDPTPRAN